MYPVLGKGYELNPGTQSGNLVYAPLIMLLDLDSHFSTTRISSGVKTGKEKKYGH
jgi:hypothetical protein